jgi:hypothetical protein
MIAVAWCTFKAACLGTSRRPAPQHQRDPYLPTSTCLSAWLTADATLLSIENTVLKEVVEGRTGELQQQGSSEYTPELNPSYSTVEQRCMAACRCVHQ